MNSLTILAIKHSPVNFKAKKNETMDIKPENLVLGSAVMPGAGQALLGKKKEAVLFAGGSVFSWGISTAGIVKITKAVLNKSAKMKSRIGNSVLGGLMVITGIIGQSLVRSISALRTMSTIVKKEDEAINERVKNLKQPSYSDTDAQYMSSKKVTEETKNPPEKEDEAA